MNLTTLSSHRGARQGRSSWTPLLMVVAAAALVACGGNTSSGASQTAAKVNKDEITVHQINFVLQQQRNLRPEQADAATKQVLERLIDQQLALQKADELKLDRDPRVVQKLEAARREVLAGAYIERLGEGAAKPTADEIKKYYDDKPALFSQRRIYSIQEISIEATPAQVDGLRARLAAAKSVNEFVDYLKTNNIRYGANQSVRAAEQLPLASLESFARMQDGQAVLVPMPQGVQVVVLAGSRSQPVTEEQARPAIEQFILNERRRKLVEDDIKALRSNAQLQYVGRFAELAASAPASAPAALGDMPGAPGMPAPAPVAAPAASSGLGASDISKGLGLK